MTTGALHNADSNELPAVARALVETVAEDRRRYARTLELVAELERENFAFLQGYPSLPALLVDLLRVSRAEAARLIDHARQPTQPSPQPATQCPPRCTFPGCTRPARWTDAHHVKHWLDGGATDLDNLVLLCRRHHRLIHHTDWTVRITNGQPEYIPPKWISPSQKPLHNTILRD